MPKITHFRINNPKIVNETIDGEVVIINFESGNYYSSNTFGCEIWSLIEQQRSIEEIIKIVKNRYTSSELNLSETVQTFLAELEREQLIVPANREESSSLELQEHPQKRAITSPPQLHKFKDMQELLLLDPIHDVDTAGWPVAKPEDK